MDDSKQNPLTGNQQVDFLEHGQDIGENTIGFSSGEPSIKIDKTLGGGTDGKPSFASAKSEDLGIRLANTRQQLETLAVVKPLDNGKPIDANDPGTAPLSEKEVLPDIQWEKPDILQSDLGEILRTAVRFAKNPQERTDIAVRIYQSLANGTLEDLPDELWSALENTDSFAINKGDFETVHKLAGQYGRDVDSKVNRISEGMPMRAPTIAILDNIAHKVGGNTRLMITRAMGVTPKVMIARLDSGIPPVELPEIDEGSLRKAIKCYEELCHPNKDRASFNQAYKQLPDIDENSISVLEKIGDIYYNFDHIPSLEEFVVEIVRKNVIGNDKKEDEPLPAT